MELKVTIEIVDKEGTFLARAPELDFVSQGRTVEEAKQNLLEVIMIQCQEMKELGTFDEYLTECGFIQKGERMLSTQEVVGGEKSTVVLGEG